MKRGEWARPARYSPSLARSTGRSLGCGIEADEPRWHFPQRALRCRPSGDRL
jgi:hypothetical protein